jgi:hypothetical protein
MGRKTADQLRSVEKHFQEGSVELQIPRFARDDKGMGNGSIESGCWIETSPESSQEHLPTSIAGLLRLSARKPVFAIDPLKRFAQDDGFVGGLKAAGWLCPKTRKDRKVTGSWDDKGRVVVP